MSDKKARYVGGSETGVNLDVLLANGERRGLHVAKGGELPHEIDGVRVDPAYKRSLLAQEDNWTEVVREKATAAKEDDKS